MKSSPAESRCLIIAAAVLAAHVFAQSVFSQPCSPPPSGLVGWWPAEGNAADIAGSNNGSLEGGLTFVAGKVGQAFNFNGTNADVRIPASSALNVGLGDGFTIEGWINPTSLAVQPIAEWNSGSYGVHFYVSPYSVGSLYANIIDSGYGDHSLGSAAGLVNAGAYQHVALTYDKTTGITIIYLNGTNVAQANLGSFTPQTSSDLYFGLRPFGPGAGYRFAGQMDDFALYNCALSSNEVQAIHTASSTGKCFTPVAPFFTTQPTNRTIFVGANTTFTVAAGGTSPLTYQWSLNTTNLAGATNATLTLTNVQLNQAGNYAVTVSNAANSVVSSNALLTVNPMQAGVMAGPIVNPANGHCYYLLATNTWTQSEALAIQLGGHLVTVNDAAENSWIYNTFSTNGGVNRTWLWIGLNDAAQEGKFVWANGEAVTYTHWAGLEPNNYNGLEHYVVLEGQPSSGGMYWNDEDDYNSPNAVGVTGANYAYGVVEVANCASGSPVITTQPTNQTVFAGGNASFTVGAFGTQPLGYQWFFNTTNLAGATNATLTLTNVQLDQAGSYSVTVSNYLNAVVSSNALLTVIPPVPPAISAQPQNQTVLQYTTASFSVTVTGTPPFTYQWQFNGTNLAGATNATLALPNVQPAQAGNYSVAVSNSVGTTNSTSATLTVQPVLAAVIDDFDPGIDFSMWSTLGATQNTNSAVINTVATNFGGFVSAPNALWLGGTGSRLVTTRAIDTTGGGLVRFYLRIANGGYYPWEAADLPGEGIVLEYAANGSNNWTEMGRYDTSAYRNWTNIAATIPAGAWSAQTKFRWRQLSNSGNPSDHWALDDTTVLTLPVAPGITGQPQNQAVYVGENTSFTVTATGTQPLSYQWQWNGTNISGATNLSLALANVQFNQAGNYSVTISNQAGAVTSSNALLTVNPPPACAAGISNLISWWRAEGNTLDAIGGNHGTLIGNTTVAAGKVGQAFVFDGNGDGILVGNPPSLQLQNLTIEGWVKRSSSTQVSASSIWGEIAGYGPNGYIVGFNQDGSLFLSKNGVSHVNSSGLINDTNWHHIAVTRNGGAVVFYRDGVLDSSTNYSATFEFTTSLWIGAVNDGAASSFLGMIDELAIYSVALSANDVQAVYNATLSGKCVAPVPPFFITQPAGLTVAAGAGATFSAVAGGSVPLAYQWRFNGTNINGATNALLTLANVQVSQAGNYSVTISNFAGSVASANALLTVNPTACVAAPANLVGWWQAESNATDMAGNNPGIASNTTFAAGKVGTAFSFDGTGEVAVSNNPSLNLTTNLTFEVWVYPTVRNGVVDTVFYKEDDSGNGPAQYSLGIRGPLNSSCPQSGVPYGNYCFAMLGINGIPSDYCGWTDGGGTVPTNQWTHLALSYDGATIKAYINGNMTRTITGLSGGLNTSSGMLRIGSRSPGALGVYPNERFNGRIDELAIYNRALSSNEIQAIYAAGISGKCQLPPPPPHGALASAILNNGFVTGVNFQDHGYGYTNLPSVRFIGGGGGGAGGYAVLSNGIVTSIIITNAGFGYTNPPLVIIAPPFIPSPDLGIAPLARLTFSNLTVGGNYQLQRQVDGLWVNESTAFTAAQTTYSRFVPGAAGSQVFRLALTPVPVEAQATAQVINGFIVSATVTAGGSGYTNPPAVTFTDGSGSNATANAILSGGAVTNIVIANAGAGYSGATQIQIDAPPVTALNPEQSPAMHVSFGNLSPYENYQLEFAPLANGGWQNNGNLLTPTSTASAADVVTTNAAGFYRLRHVP